MDIFLDEEHLTRTVMLANIEDSRSFKALNIPAGLQLRLDLEVVLHVQLVLMYTLHETRPIDIVHAGEVLTHCL